MCKSTKGTQSAHNAAVMEIQPNTAPTDNGDTPTPDPTPTPTPTPTPQGPETIVREHVPDIVFIIPGTDPTVQSTVDFHEFFGFRGTRLKRFSSIENMISQLASASTAINRLRIVAHADREGIFSPMVEGDSSVNIESDQLRAFIQGDGPWLFTKIGEFHFFGSGSAASQIAEVILQHIQQDTNHQSVLTPFNITSLSFIRPELVNYILCAVTTLSIQGNHIEKDGTALNTAEKDALSFVFDKILEVSRQNVIDGGNYTGVTATNLDNLRDSIRNFSFQDYGFSPGTSDLSTDTMNSIVVSVQALRNNFRTNLESVQQRFSGTSWVDIRGCRAGTDRDYLRAISEFFGTAGNLPHVSGPTWFQKFPTIGFRDFSGSADIDDVFDNGIPGHNGTNISSFSLKSALDQWLGFILYDTAYFSAWRTALNKTASEFCLLTWRNDIPTLFIREGKQRGIASLSFIDTIKRIKDIFEVSTSSQPTQATLNGLQNFVENELPALMTPLLQEIPNSGPFDQFFSELSGISQQLSASVVPGTSPTGLDANTLRQYQTDLIDFIDTNRLSHIKSLLTTAQTHINGSNGKYHLYLQFGLPGMVFFERNFQNNQIFALASEKDNALRIFLREMWEEPLPTPNNIAGARLSSSRDSDRAVAGLANDRQDTRVAIGPMPEYMRNIETI